LLDSIDDCGRGRESGDSEAHARDGFWVFEIALPFRGNAYRLVYAVQLAQAVWVVHAFQKKSTQGIKTPARELQLVRERLKRLKETLS